MKWKKMRKSSSGNSKVICNVGMLNSLNFLQIYFKSVLKTSDWKNSYEDNHTNVALGLNH